LKYVQHFVSYAAGANQLQHSIANAYIEVIKNSDHFVYIENQFFITASDEKQRPVRNMIGQAIVDRVLRAAREGQKYHMIVAIPAIPAFAGDLRSDDALSTRAIMEYQYNSICRGGNSIYERIAQAGINPMDYLRFYNLRNYDRINTSAAMSAVEQKAGVSYEDARKEFDDRYGGGFEGGEPGQGGYGDRPQYPAGAVEHYQEAAKQVGEREGLGNGRWDTVAECYMLGGVDIRNVPWERGNVDEIDAFVTEELYIHSKVSLCQVSKSACNTNIYLAPHRRRPYCDLRLC
jgi:phospholipase D1/2